MSASLSLTHIDLSDFQQAGYDDDDDEYICELSNIDDGDDLDSLLDVTAMANVQCAIVVVCASLQHRKQIEAWLFTISLLS